MCGIGGWVDFGGQLEVQMKSVGQSLVASMKHRGPDGFGVEVFGGEGDNRIARSCIDGCRFWD